MVMSVKKHTNICPYCNKKVDSHHIRENHERKSLNCAKCGHVFLRKEYMIKHKCPRDEDSRPHLCEHCGKRFPSEEKLKSHFKYKSQVCPRYKCDKCPKKFCTLSKLNNHMKMHPVAQISVTQD